MKPMELFIREKRIQTMRITKSQLRRIIKEESAKTLRLRLRLSLSEGEEVNPINPTADDLRKLFLSLSNTGDTNSSKIRDNEREIIYKIVTTLMSASKVGEIDRGRVYNEVEQGYVQLQKIIADKGAAAAEEQDP